MSLPFNEKRLQVLYDPTAQEKSSKIRKIDKSDTKNIEKSKSTHQTCIAYYMHRDVRIHDNWAYIYAQNCAIEEKLPLLVISEIFFEKDDVGATLRNLDFKIGGLKEVEKTCGKLNVRFELLGQKQNKATTTSSLTDFIKASKYKFKKLILDFSPLKPFRKNFLPNLQKFLKKEEATKNFTTLVQVDAHNVVPVWEASNKKEYGARTIRPKIMGKLSEFLTEFPECKKLKIGFDADQKSSSTSKSSSIDWEKYENSFKKSINQNIKPTQKFKPGPKNGQKMLEDFIENRLKNYKNNRNNPNLDGTSNLSPWLHFGQISAQQAAYKIKKSKKPKEDIDTFIEEAVVRSELADNFCNYCDDYDNLKGGYEWAQNSLKLHEKDKREYIYTFKQLEESETHDNLWNAAQKQLFQEGKLHGFLRMYWAKKILEWTKSPKQALEFSIHLNDKYSLDGCDPNGFTGCMWSVVGAHDRAWTERTVFGKIRYMNYAGCKRKFDVEKFEEKYMGTE